MQAPLAPTPAITGVLHGNIFRLGWENGEFSDVTVSALGRTYPAHKILLSQSPFFEKLLRGPWMEAASPNVDLHIDDPNIGSDTLTHALQFLYGRPVEVNSVNVFGILAVASFLGLEPLCKICVDFAVQDLTVDTFYGYYSFSKSYEYGNYTEVVRWACMDFLRLHGFGEARSVLRELEQEDLVKLLQDDDFWVPTELDRFELLMDLMGGFEAAVKEHWSESSGLSLLIRILEGLRYEHVQPQELERIAGTVPEGMPGVHHAIRLGKQRQMLLKQELTAKLRRPLQRAIHLRSRSDSSVLVELGEAFGDTYQAFRLGIEFASVGDVYKRKGLNSAEFYYAGSLWRLRIAERRPHPSSPAYIGVFIHRREACGMRWGMSDRRADVCAALRVRIGWASWKIEKECEGHFNSDTWDSYGWPQFMKQESLNHCLESDGSLRVVVRVCLKC